MNKVSIDKKFFELKSSISAGLISGLKKLTARGFVIESKDLDLTKMEYLQSILKLENISIDNFPEKEIEKQFFITTEKTKVKNSIVVAGKTQIDTFKKAVDRILTNLRYSSQHRKTKETDIEIELSLDG